MPGAATLVASSADFAKVSFGVWTTVKRCLHPNSLWLFSAFLGLGALMVSPMRLLGQEKAPPKGLVSHRDTPALRHGNRNVDQLIQQVIQQMEVSGQVLANEGTPSTRLTRQAEIAPGPAPLLSFRSFDRDARYRLGKLDLVVDDAGH
jgi:hypothetical protein